MMNAIPISHYAEIRGGLEEGFGVLEESLDKAGYFPYVSTLTGGIRILYGQIQLIMGVALTAIFRFLDLMRGGIEWEEEAVRAFDYTIHGFANMARGMVECFRWVNLLCFIFDRFVEAERDKLRLKYDRPILFLRNVREYRWTTT